MAQAVRVPHGQLQQTSLQLSSASLTDVQASAHEDGPQGCDGSMMASYKPQTVSVPYLHTAVRSLPLYPSACSATRLKQSSVSECFTPCMAPCRMTCLAAASGKGTSKRAATLLKAASSSSQGAFVAAMTTTRPAAALLGCLELQEALLLSLWDPGLVAMPSMNAKNSLVTRLLASPAPPGPSAAKPPRFASSESTSSMNMTAGAAAAASSNRRRTFCSDSPYHLLSTLLLVTAKKLAPEAAAATKRKMYNQGTNPPQVHTVQT